MKALNVISTAYRATLEEQDDTIVWLSHALKGAGADLDVLLRGSAVNYVVQGQEIEPLSFGDRRQKNSPRIPDDIASLISKDITVFVMSDDLTAYGIDQAQLIRGVEIIGGSDVPKLFDKYDHVWTW